MKHQIGGRTIHTEFVCPPLGTRAFDWSAITDDYDGAPDSTNRHQIGYGPTQEAAIADLLDQMEGSL